MLNLEVLLLGRDALLCECVFSFVDECVPSRPGEGRGVHCSRTHGGPHRVGKGATGGAGVISGA